ncbi:P-loop containing nucleoside triphosphate hydrolase [Glarea lozoyensis ATCC 20868]|uniref:Vesicular-fusion protein SEC18 n=1 Tax=Glarea lozoyensis (strain ATCC 20868 / MF5171) TaxID=1116229 RepID=S3DBJ1_GLAL2|nr:P-loop containing nucleoside triphosphate hydrolase [Glarea lozoyensis ATCC 20868]EPE29316.1 P-loop containing nucleoside triphosphate hydrolase [Glarea lozoyensis ATCC 20868]
MNIRQNLFGQGPKAGREQQGGYGRPPQPPPRDDTPMGGYQENPRGQYGGGGYSAPPAGGMPLRTAVGREPSQQPMGSGAPRRVQMRIAKVEDKNLANEYIFGNLCAVSPQDFPPSRDGSDPYILINGRYVVTGRPTPGFPAGCISLSDPQRTWCDVGMMDPITAETYDPFASGGHAYLGSLDIEVGFASVRKVTEVPFDQDVLADVFTRFFNNQIFAPGQLLLMDYKNIPLLFTVKTIQVVDLSMQKEGPPPTSNPGARGILTQQTSMTFYKDAKSPIKLKGSTKRPAANSIIAPDFKFEDMGIGGLDTEFSAIFRRAFASRIFPPGLIEKLGIQHVKGILLFGPPGTGKTLIARQIGKMLNSREPKVINGPEVLNKYVGQSEENIRKLFADAEKEYKEKGDESGLHIIIFDELDAVCKQRGSGAGGGTGVGDSVVNQLLSKLDGVDQLNNILLIGMTNRMDMIDDALLRPGRLEVHMEISLPDEAGRAQILKIHTSKMKENDVMDSDVNVAELAHLTKNFSGAEIGGLVKSASSFAFNRHVKVGTVAGVSDDIENMKVNRADFMNALDEVKAAFGVSEEELETAMKHGIIHFSPYIENILNQGALAVDYIKSAPEASLLSVLLHGPPGSGKTAIAAKIAKDSEFPFIKLVSAENMVGFSEMAKIQYLQKVFTDAYKSPLNIVVIDNIERIIEWSNIGARFSNPITQALLVLIAKQPPAGRRLLVIGTTSQRSIMAQLDLKQIFNRELAVPNINTHAELASALREVGGFDREEDMTASLNELKDITGTDQIGVGIKNVLTTVGQAKRDKLNFVGTFADMMAQQMASNN